MTQEFLAGQLGIHPTHVSNIERGETVPKAETVLKLIEVLGTTGDALFEGIEWDAERGVFEVTQA
jgi:transcriptional regulator with XRE-family HTH domain